MEKRYDIKLTYTQRRAAAELENEMVEADDLGQFAAAMIGMDARIADLEAENAALKTHNEAVTELVSALSELRHCTEQLDTVRLQQGHYAVFPRSFGDRLAKADVQADTLLKMFS